jgi:hypothetical protein
VLLPTGDQMTVVTAPDGRRTATATTAARAGVGSVLYHLELGGHSSEIPAAALPHLGRGLDLRLFDVAALAEAEAETGAREAECRCASPTLRPRCPAHRTGGQASYLTVGSAADFGQALVSSTWPSGRAVRSAAGASSPAAVGWRWPVPPRRRTSTRATPCTH